MKKKTLLISLLLMIVMSFTGCDVLRALKLPDDPAIFELASIKDEKDDTSYASITYDGRTYVTYGIFSDYYADKLVSVIGYINESDKLINCRYICTLTDTQNQDLIASVSVNNSTQANIWRDITTLDKDIDIPDYVRSLDYLYWNEVSDNASVE